MIQEIKQQDPSGGAGNVTGDPELLGNLLSAINILSINAQSC